jgi:hypothetical protein
MDKAKLAQNLAGLADLAELNGVDVRPTLLRVLTDLYLQKSRHTQEEERHYSELALRLIELVDVPTRASIAGKLAVYPTAPLPVMRRLARDVLAVAAPVLRQSRQLSREELHAIAAELGQGHAAMIATRAGEAPAAPSAPPRVKPARSMAEEAWRGRTPLTAPTSAKELNDLFFFASAAERRLILLNLDYSAFEPVRPARAADAAAVGRLERTALARRPDQFAHELAPLIDISREQALRVARDELGEPVVVAAKALGMPAPVLQRVTLFLNPTIGESVKRVYELAALFDEITHDAAEAMVSIWREARGAPARAAHQPLHYDDDAGRATTSTTRPPAAPQTGTRRSA